MTSGSFPAAEIRRMKKDIHPDVPPYKEKITITFPVAIRLGETPVPIPNTMVKPQTADGTVRGTARESRRLPEYRGLSSAGRAPALQAGGREFESLSLHCGADAAGAHLENRILKDIYSRKRA